MYYESAWRHSSVQDPRVWPIWETVRKYSGKGPLLEIGPGNLPKIPVKGSYFVELSTSAVHNLNKAGGHAYKATSRLPFRASFFSLIACFEVMEHVKEDKRLFGEIARVLKPKGILLLSVPINMEHWMKWDEKAGHYRRYDPGKLVKYLETQGFTLVQFSVSGIQNTINKSRLLGNYINPFLIRFAALSTVRISLLLPIVTFFERMKGIEWHTSGLAEKAQSQTNLTLVLRKK